jgi:hypothetical protein
MNVHKKERTTPKIAGSPVYGKGSLLASPGNSVYKHQGKYHVFVGLKEVLVTEDVQSALVEAARNRTL